MSKKMSGSSLEDRMNFSPSKATMPKPELFKVLMIGDSTVGKTKLLNKFCEGERELPLVSTIGKSNLALTVNK